MQRLCEYILFTGFGPFHRMYTLLQSRPSPDGYPAGSPPPFSSFRRLLAHKTFTQQKSKTTTTLIALKAKPVVRKYYIYVELLLYNACFNCYLIIYVEWKSANSTTRSKNARYREDNNNNNHNPRTVLKLYTMMIAQSWRQSQTNMVNISSTTMRSGGKCER